jgi:hypothetical protein
LFSKAIALTDAINATVLKKRQEDFMVRIENKWSDISQTKETAMEVERLNVRKLKIEEFGNRTRMS